jgi:hypothetical protein
MHAYLTITKAKQVLEASPEIRIHCAEGLGWFSDFKVPKALGFNTHYISSAALNNLMKTGYIEFERITASKMGIWKKTGAQ